MRPQRGYRLRGNDRRSAARRARESATGDKGASERASPPTTANAPGWQPRSRRARGNAAVRTQAFLGSIVHEAEPGPPEAGVSSPRRPELDAMGSPLRVPRRARAIRGGKALPRVAGRLRPALDAAAGSTTSGQDRSRRSPGAPVSRAHLWPLGDRATCGVPRELREQARRRAARIGPERSRPYRHARIYGNQIACGPCSHWDARRPFAAYALTTPMNSSRLLRVSTICRRGGRMGSSRGFQLARKAGPAGGGLEDYALPGVEPPARAERSCSSTGSSKSRLPKPKPAPAYARPRGRRHFPDEAVATCERTEYLRVRSRSPPSRPRSKMLLAARYPLTRRQPKKP